jgi:NADPH-dependent 2,4-dienoyl-CoA reductase/sulfur reductase-like enzyme
VLAGAVASDAQLRFSAGVGEAVLADLAQRVKEVVRAPVLAAGRILTGDGAEAVLRGGQADLLTVGRALLADPAWLAKTRAGLELEVAPCIGCMACYTPAPDGGIGCPVNGEAGQEHLPPLPGIAAPRRVAVLGASLAGLEVARVAASRGHEVTLATDGLPLGGLLGLRAGVPGNAEFGRAFLYLGDRLVELGVSIADASPEEVAAEAEVTVDCRAGAERRPGWASRGQGVFPAGDILGRELHQMYGIGRRVAVAGPGALAAEVALFLAGWGRRPTVIVPGPEEDPFPDVHPMHAARLRERLEGYKVPLVTGATPVAWKFDPQRKSELVVRRAPAAGRTARRPGGRTKGAAEGEEALGPFQSVVTAEGWAPPAGQRSRVEGGSQGREGSVASGEENRWPQAVFGLQAPDGVPDGVPSGARLVLGDTPFVEPLRDLVQYAHLLGRTL